MNNLFEAVLIKGKLVPQRLLGVFSAKSGNQYVQNVQTDI